MNKSQLIEAVAPTAAFEGRSSRAIESLLDTVTKTLKKGDEVSDHGLRQVLGRERAARQGVNPRRVSA